MAAVRGTLVHAVLEDLFALEPQERTPQTAIDLITPAWQGMADRDPALPSLLLGPEENWTRSLNGEPLIPPADDAAAPLFAEAEKHLGKYFTLEDPRRLQPAERELPVSHELPSGLTLRGVIDRLDVAQNGAVRVVDYKTGRAPGAGWESTALFQMRFYGLVLWRMRGRVPDRLLLIYLGNTETLSVSPTQQELVATERKLEAIWAAIERSIETNDWSPRPSRTCSWCSFQSVCPAKGGRGTAEPSSVGGEHRGADVSGSSE